MAIDSGADRLKQLHDREQNRGQNRERQQLFNRLHVVLMQAPGHDREATRTWLGTVEAMTPEERATAIQQRFGDRVLERCQPALNQLQHVGL
jgi:hypothetical protein